MPSAIFQLTEVQSTLLPVLDIVDGRVEDARVPDWCERRGWTRFLLELSPSDLARCETEGLATTAPFLDGAPADLLTLAARLRNLCSLPALPSPSATSAGPHTLEFRGVTSRKQAQLSALLAALTGLVPSARRIVDVGAGSGHFSRLSAQHFARETLGLEQNPARVERAIARARADVTPGAPLPSFAVMDAVREPLLLRRDDLAIGLHACGELGDALVRAAASSGADLVLVSCCLQKIAGTRRVALSSAAGDFGLRRETLGLSNLTSQAMGIETSIESTLRARQARYALRLLLQARGISVVPGAEMHGINRRRARGGLRELAELALEQRGLAQATSDEIARHELTAARHFEQLRRFSLPRNMLARAVELSVILDRAAHLEERGHTVRIATLFERAVTPRNIALFASRDASRLPEAAPRLKQAELS